MVPGFEVVGMVLDVRVAFAAILEQHLAANGVERLPLFVVRGRSQLMSVVTIVL